MPITLPTAPACSSPEQSQAECPNASPQPLFILGLPLFPLPLLLQAPLPPLREEQASQQTSSPRHLPWPRTKLCPAGRQASPWTEGWRPPEEAEQVGPTRALPRPHPHLEKASTPHFGPEVATVPQSSPAGSTKETWARRGGGGKRKVLIQEPCKPPGGGGLSPFDSAPRAHWAMCGYICGCHNWGCFWHQVGGTRVNTPQFPETSSPNASSAGTARGWETLGGTEHWQRA